MASYHYIFPSLWQTQLDSVIASAGNKVECNTNSHHLTTTGQFTIHTTPPAVPWLTQNYCSTICIRCFNCINFHLPGCAEVCVEGEATEGTVELEVTEGEPHPTVSTMSFHHNTNATTLVTPLPPPPPTTTKESHPTNNIGYGFPL